MELGQVHYNEHDRRWERFDGQSWTAIVVRPAATETEIIVYESTDNAE
jgi:hypothetical protein